MKYEKYEIILKKWLTDRARPDTMTDLKWSTE
jgi:hypothetical protein